MRTPESHRYGSKSSEAKIHEGRCGKEAGMSNPSAPTDFNPDIR